MLRPTTRRAVCCLLLAAVAHLLGASRCGCWEHSGWRAAIALVAGEALTPDPGDEHCEAQDCEPHAVLTATTAARTAGDGSTDMALIAPATGDFFVDANAVVASASRRPMVGGPAPPVRAQLQVFRL